MIKIAAMPDLVENDNYYLTESELASPLDDDKVLHAFHFFAVDGENAKILADEQKLPHRHEFQEIIWIRRGSADHLLDGTWQKIRPRTLLIVPKGRVHWFMPSDRFEGCVIRFRDFLLPATPSILFTQFADPSQSIVPKEEIAVMESLFSVIGEEYRHFDEHHGKIIIFVLQALLAKLETFRWCALENQPRSCTVKQGFMDEFNSLVEQHYRSRHSVGFYAQKIGLSSRKMNENLRSVLGKTATEVIEERRILEAKRLTLFSDLSLKEIAFELGYDEHSYFTRVFRKITGCTPSEFKQGLSD